MNRGNAIQHPECRTHRLFAFRSVRTGLGRTLLIWFLLLALVPMTVVSVVSYHNAHRSLQAAAERTLVAGAKLTTARIDAYFERMLTDLNLQAEMVQTVNLLAALGAAYESGGKPLKEFVSSFRWAQIVDEKAGDLKAYRRVYGYYDMFLVDPAGNVLYTVANEDDMGTNLLTGTYAGTRLAAAFRTSLGTGRPAFSDYEAYAPSGGLVSGFMTAVVLDEEGDPLGVLALQFPIHGIDRIMHADTGMGRRTELYLVGPDLRMRSNLQDKETVLIREVRTAGTELWLKEHSKGDVAKHEDWSATLYSGPGGEQVLGVHSTIRIGDVEFGVLAETAAAEAFAAAEDLRRMVTGLLLATGLVVLLLSTAVAGRIVGPLSRGADMLAASARQISATVAQIAAAAREAASAISETTSTVGEVRQTAQASSNTAKAVLDTSVRAVKAANRGAQATDDSSNGMTAINSEMAVIAQTITELSEQSRTISDIITSVGDIADQSNLLAVNAAIEAAKAGEHGHGFTVVAQEIRGLSEQSKEATGRVRAILGEIQKATSRAVLATEQGSAAVYRGAEEVREAAEAIRQLADSVREASTSATQIAASSQQQLVGMEQVGSAMESIREVSGQNQQSAQQLAREATGLQDLGEELRRMVGGQGESHG